MAERLSDAGQSARVGPRTDRLVVLRAAAYGQLLATPGALANAALAGRDDVSDALVAASFLAVVAGFAIAGFAAGRAADHEVARHGALAGLVAFVPVELLAILGRADRGDPIRLPAMVLHAGIAAIVAMALARLGARVRAARAIQTERRTQTDPEEAP